MLRDFGLFLSYFARFLKARMEYRADFFAEIAASAVRAALSLLFVFAVFLPVDAIGGWRRDEVLFVYGFAMMPYALFATISWNLYEFGDRYIIEGQFDRVLLRPVNTFLQVAFESFRIQALSEFAIGFVVARTAAVRLGLEFGVLDLAWAAAAVLSGAVIFTSVFGTVAALGFFFEDRIGIAPPLFNLIQAGRWPIDLFGPAIRFLLRWVVPFAFVAFYPSTRLLGREEFRDLCMLSPLVSAASLAVLASVWTAGVRRYASTGS